MCKATEIKASVRVYQHTELSLVFLMERAFCTKGAHQSCHQLNHDKVIFPDAYFLYLLYYNSKVCAVLSFILYA